MKKILFVILFLISCGSNREVKNCLEKQDFERNLNAAHIINKIINCNFKKHETVYIVYISKGAYKGLIFITPHDEDFSFRLDLLEGRIKIFDKSEISDVKNFNVSAFKRILNEKPHIKDLDFSHPTNIGLLVFKNKKYKYEITRRMNTIESSKLKKIGFSKLPFKNEFYLYIRYPSLFSQIYSN